MNKLLPVLVAVVLLAGCKNENTATTDELPSVPYALEVSPFFSAQMGRGFLFKGAIPENYPEKEKPFGAVMFCGTQWRYVNEQQRDLWTNFSMWVDTSAAAIDRNSITYRDIKVSCETDSTITFVSSSFDKTLALLSPTGQDAGSLNRSARAVEFYTPTGTVKLSVGAGSIDFERLQAGGEVFVRKADSLVVLGGPAAPKPYTYDPAQPVEVYVRRGANAGPWDVFTILYNKGSFKWRVTSKNPA